MFEVRNLVKAYKKPFSGGRVVALDGVSFVLKKGEIVGLIGPNGAGKTTLIKILGQLLLPDQGQIFLDGWNIFESRESFLKKAGIMLGEQIHYLYEGLTCGENLQLFINLKNIFGSAGRQELERLLEILHLKDFFNFKVRDLSTGYKKRVALAIALIGNPEILLLDEPLSGIDPENAFYLRRLIEDYSQRATVFWASHNLSEVAGLCGRVLLIKKGRIIFNGIFGTQKGNYLNDLEKVFIELVSSRH